MRVQKIMFDCLESLIRCTPQSGDSSSSIVVSKQAQETLSHSDSEKDKMIEDNTEKSAREFCICRYSRKSTLTLNTIQSHNNH